MTEDEKQFLEAAARYLGRPSLLVRLTDLIGKPIEIGIQRLPAPAQAFVTRTTHRALETALGLAVRTIPSRPWRDFSASTQSAARTDRNHTLLTGLCGGVGGLFGLPALAIELPVSTTLMLRSIAAIAADYGHDPNDLRIRLECLSVFALGSPSKGDDAMENAYFATRIAMGRLVNEAAAWLAQRTAAEISEALVSRTAPVLIRFITRVAARFEVVITEKAMAEILPAIGALSGALVNTAFSDHFNTVARYHFGVRALELKYGEQEISTRFKDILVKSKS